MAVRELETAMEGHSNLAESMEATSKGLAEQIVTHDENITNHSAANGMASDGAVDAADTAAQLLVEQREVALMHEHAELVKKNIVATKVKMRTAHPLAFASRHNRRTATGARAPRQHYHALSANRSSSRRRRKSSKSASFSGASRRRTWPTRRVSCSS